ncbi:Serine/threonine-protein kinase Sgk2 [Balamuthia mandrillaris]
MWLGVEAPYSAGGDENETTVWLAPELMEQIMMEVAQEARALASARAVCREWQLFIDERDALLWRRCALDLLQASFCQFLEPLVGPSSSSLYNSWREACAAEVACPSLSDFELLRVINRFDGGKNMAVRRKTDAEKKKRRKAKGKQDAELILLKVSRFSTVDGMRGYKRNITKLHALQSPRFLRVVHPWLKNETGFVDLKHIKTFTVLELAGGGELFFHLQRNRWFSVQQTSFFVAQLMLAMECLQEAGLPFPSFQPEYILLDGDGYLKLDCYWALLHEDPERTKTCTTSQVEYTAPEAFGEKKASLEECLWTLGCLSYEMLHGLPPFYDENQAHMIAAIQNTAVRWSSSSAAPKVPASCRQFVETLLEKDPQKRKTALNNFRNHAFFKEHGFADEAAWRQLEENAMEAPYKPPPQPSPDDFICDGPFVTERVDDYSTFDNFRFDASAFEGFTYCPPQQHGE